MKPLTPERHADTFDWCGPLVQGIVTREFPKHSRILDVGPCWGKYRYLLPEYPFMDACEVWLPYVMEEDLSRMYHRVWVADICDHVLSPQMERYDLAILGDVFEHIERDRAKEMLGQLMVWCGEVIVVVPYRYEQGPEHGNPHQVHQQADLTPELMAAEYPELQRAAVEIRDGGEFKGLYRRRK